jgi:hypothetical protein
MLYEPVNVSSCGWRAWSIFDISRCSIRKGYDGAGAIELFLPEFCLSFAAVFFCKFAVCCARAFQYPLTPDRTPDKEVFGVGERDKLEWHSILSIRRR